MKKKQLISGPLQVTTLREAEEVQQTMILFKGFVYSKVKIFSAEGAAFHCTIQARHLSVFGGT